MRGELIGREREMGQIAAALAAARSGRGGALVVTGEPGAGKTRLAAEALGAAAAAGMVTIRGRAGTVGPPVPYRPMVEALLLLARTGLLPDPDELGHYGPVLTRLLNGAQDAGPGAASHILVAETMLRVLAAVGGRPAGQPGQREQQGQPGQQGQQGWRGCLLVLDDLHDSDAGTLAVVEYLLYNIGQQSAVLLLIAGCAPCTVTGLAVRARQYGAAEVLDLPPLGRSDVHLLVAAELGIAPERVCSGLVERVVAGSAGIPFVVKELVRDPAALHGTPVPSVPTAVAVRVRRQAERLGPLGLQFLSMAALFGRRFPLPVLEHAIGRDHGELSAILRAAVASHLITPDGSDTQWYAFRYGLAAEALTAGLGPGERAGHARLLARALTALHPGLPGAWCAHAARLHEHGGDTEEAIRLYGEAAARAMSEGGEGMADRAVALLTRAHHLLGPTTAPDVHATVLEQLLDAVARSARCDRVPAPPTVLDGDGSMPGIPARRQAGIHARLSGIATLAGRPAQALRHADTARKLLGVHHPFDDHTTLVDITAAYAELHRPGPYRLRTATRFARRALDTARRTGLPEAECEALLLLGQLAREQDEPTATAHFEQARTVALAQRLPALLVTAEVRLATVAASHDGQPGRIERARREALRMGLQPPAYEAGFALALDRIRRCEFAEAQDLIREEAAGAERRGLGRHLAMMRLAEAVCHAHQGRRAPMEEALERLAPLIDAAPGLRAMSYGQARAFCSLLEERHEAAVHEFAQALAYDVENPATSEFGKHGIILLLGVLAGRMGRQHYAAAVRASVSRTRWNRQFVGLADAVLLGREGRPGEAAAAAGKALEVSDPYPMARRLCLRLVARHAHEDGWGEPVEWLREAEEYFHGAGLQVVAGAGRALLRGMGASVRQRRTGTEQVPPELRRCGITVREFEVARLVAERIANKDIAGRLHISPRTVEKHVASLLQKTGHPNRRAFASAARDLVP
ncbi:AAA family ATPase [Streptomyces nondiastaticus]|uniref:helix-turn-helix transcriptional regulator n=1 Tax=Streptomyces nondiastaticus TaxID=3154512 RepID=UPI0034203269